MDHQIDQPSSNISTNSDELQLAALTQHNRRLTREILPFDVNHYHHQDESNIILNTAKQLKCHNFAVEQQPLLSLPEKASQVSGTAFLSYLVEIYRAQLTEGSVLFICNPLTNTYTSLTYDTLYNPLSDTLFEFLNGVWSEIQLLDREGIFRKSSFDILKRLAPTLNANASHSRKESVHKIARPEIEGFTHLLNIYIYIYIYNIYIYIYISSVKDADLNGEEI